jgi:anti-sigma factor RsiW
MTCTELVAAISDYIDGTLSPERLAQVEAHLAKCDHCDCVTDSTRQTIELLRARAKTKLPDARRDALLARLEAVLPRCSRGE